MNKFATITTLSLAAVFGLTACSTPGAPTSEPASQSPTATVESPAPFTVPEETTPVVTAPEVTTPAPEPASEGTTGTAKFGTVWKYADGLTVSVTHAGNGTASDTAAGGEKTAGAMQLFNVTVTNGTKAIFDPSLVHITANYGPEGVAADRVFDSAQQIGDNFQGKILPGKKQTVKVAFAMPANATDIIVLVAPDFEHDDALFVK